MSPDQRSLRHAFASAPFGTPPAGASCALPEWGHASTCLIPRQEPARHNNTEDNAMKRPVLTLFVLLSLLSVPARAAESTGNYCDAETDCPEAGEVCDREGSIEACDADGYCACFQGDCITDGDCEVGTCVDDGTSLACDTSGDDGESVTGCASTEAPQHTLLGGVLLLGAVALLRRGRVR